MITIIKQILVKFYFKLRDLIYVFLGSIETNKYFRDNTDKAFLVGTPEHDNMGDHAIALSEIAFINKHFPGYKIIEITVESWRKYKNNLKKYVKPNDMFFLTGGGNMGDIYVLDEELRRFIISSFKDNKITIFPQTIYFTNTQRGKKELDKTISTYRNHHKLLICARENMSYELMKKYFGEGKVFLCPDMVLGWDINRFERSKPIYDIGLCLRNDCEKSEIEKHIDLTKLKEDFNVQEFNTCHTSGINKSERIKYISELLKVISANKVIITDRLHCLILASKLGIPCIVSSGDSHKIKSTLKWLTTAHEIKEYMKTDDLYQIVSLLLSQGHEVFENKYEDYFIALSERIKRL